MSNRGSQKFQIPRVSQNKLKLTGVLEFVKLFPWLLLQPTTELHHVLLFWGHYSSVGKTSMLLLWFQCLMTCCWRPPRSFQGCSILPYPRVFHRSAWGMFLPWDGARCFLHVLGGIPRTTWTEKSTDVSIDWVSHDDVADCGEYQMGYNLAPIPEVFCRTRYIQNRMSFYFRISANMD